MVQLTFLFVSSLNPKYAEKISLVFISPCRYKHNPVFKSMACDLSFAALQRPNAHFQTTRTNERARAPLHTHTQRQHNIYIVSLELSDYLFIVASTQQPIFERKNPWTVHSYTLTHQKYSMQIENLFIKRAVFISQNVVTFCIISRSWIFTSI